MPHFHHFSMCNQNESISILVILRQNTKVITLLFGQKCLIFITFQCAIKMNQFQFWSFFGNMPKAIALLFGQKCLIFITFNVQSKWINFNFGHLSAKYQGHSLTFWPKMAHFHHLSMCNQNESTSILVIFRQNTKVIALLLGQRWLIVITFQCAITINQFQFWSFLSKMPKAIALLFGQKCLIFITFNVQSKWINVNFGHFSANYQKS